jgi:hypothetical protein
MMSSWPPFLRTDVPRRRAALGLRTGTVMPGGAAILPRGCGVCCLRCAALLLLVCTLQMPRLRAQAPDDVLSPHEVDELRDAAFVPRDRLAVYLQILDDRQKQIDRLLATRRSHTDFDTEMHDALEQFGALADELNDNLDEYSRNHRDVRKALPRLIQATERWSTTLRSPPDQEAYAVVRKIALDNVKDTRDLCQSLQTDLDAWFKAHPDAEKEEKKRYSDPHAVRSGEGGP